MAETRLNIQISAEDKASGVLGKLGGTLEKLQPAFTKMAAVGAAGLGGLAVAAYSFVDAARESSMVAAATEQVLKTMGGASGRTSVQISDLAGRLEEVSLYSDEAIQSGQNLLLTFGNIKGDQFDQATRAMVDLSQAMGQDMKSSAIQLGKALNDPVEGVSALARVGVSFSESQKNTIKRLAETGKVAEAQGIVLAELNRQFGGQASAAREAAGPLADLQMIFGRLQEVIGGRLLPVFDSLLAKLVPIFSSVAQWAAQNTDLVVQIMGIAAAGSAVIGLAGGLGLLVPILISLTTAALPWIAAGAAIAGVAYLIYQAYETNFYGFRDVVINTLSTISQKWAEWGPQIMATVQALVAFLLQKWNEWGPVILEATIQALAFVRQKWEEFAPIVQAAADNISKVVTNVFTAVKTFLEEHGTELQAIFSGTWEAIKAIVAPALAFIKLLIETNMALIDGVVKVALQLLAGDFRGAWEQIQTTASTMLASFVAFLQTIWDGIVGDVVKFTVKMVEEFQKLPERIIEAFKQLGGMLAEAMTSAMQQALDAMTKGAQGMVDQAFRTAGQIANALNPANLFNGGGGGEGQKFSSGGIGKRASGGPVSGGTPYIVGEQGPELFIPSASGAILPNSALKGSGAGAGGAGTTNISFDFSGSTLLSENTAKQITDLVISRLQKTSRIPSRSF